MLAQEVGVSERTLRRAVNQGAIRAIRPTPRTLKISLSERAYIRRSWTLLFALRAALRTERNVRFAALYGSAARGTDTQASDVDIAIDLRDPSLDRVVDLSTKLSDIIGRPVDLVRLHDVQADPPLLADLISHGRVLVDRDGVWPRLRRRESSLRHRWRWEESERARTALAGIDRLLES